MLEEWRQQRVRCLIGTSGLYQHAVAAVAGDVADPGDDEVGHRVGEEPCVLIEDKERECVGARRA